MSILKTACVSVFLLKTCLSLCSSAVSLSPKTQVLRYESSKVHCTQILRSFPWATAFNLGPHPVLPGYRCSCVVTWLTLPLTATLVTRHQVWDACPRHQWLCSWVLVPGLALASETRHVSHPDPPDPAGSLCPEKRWDMKTIRPSPGIMNSDSGPTVYKQCFPKKFWDKFNPHVLVVQNIMTTYLPDRPLGFTAQGMMMWKPRAKLQGWRRVESNLHSPNPALRTETFHPVICPHLMIPISQFWGLVSGPSLTPFSRHTIRNRITDPGAIAPLFDRGTM